MCRAVFVLAIISGCTDSGPGAATAQSACRSTSDHDAFRVLVLGDSIAAGYPLVQPNRWSDKLEQGLRQELPDFDVELRNDARSATQIDFLESSVAAHKDLWKYQVAIVIEGVNDVGVIPHAEWVRRYRTVIETIEAGGPAVIIGTPPPILAGGRFHSDGDRVAESLRRIAAQSDRLVLDIALLWRDLGAGAAAKLYADTIHPNLEGQTRIADLALRIALSTAPDCQLREST